MREEADAAAEFAGRFLFERRLWAAGSRRVAGVDEVGRGPLAGPVVAAAVVLPRDAWLPGLDDSKRLTAARRQGLVAAIKAQAAAWCVAEVDVEAIDRLNIAQASFEAMRQALAGLGVGVDHVLVDGFRIPGYGGDQTAIVGGDHLSNSIAAASVLAKVHRDARMAAWDAVWPGYGFARHKGYGTAEHVAALQRLGPCPLHRRSFSWGQDDASEAKLGRSRAGMGREDANRSRESGGGEAGSRGARTEQAERQAASSRPAQLHLAAGALEIAAEAAAATAAAAAAAAADVAVAVAAAATADAAVAAAAANAEAAAAATADAAVAVAAADAEAAVAAAAATDASTAAGAAAAAAGTAATGAAAVAEAVGSLK